MGVSSLTGLRTTGLIRELNKIFSLKHLSYSKHRTKCDLKINQGCEINEVGICSTDATFVAEVGRHLGSEAFNYMKRKDDFMSKAIS